MKKYKAAVLLVAGLTFGVTACSGSMDTAEEKAALGQETAGAAEQEYGGDAGSSGAESSRDAGSDNTEESRNAGTGDEASKDSAAVVTGGYRFLLPEDLSATVNDQGLILTDEDMNYQMLVTVRDYNFEDRKADKESLAENVRAAGYDITRDVEITSAGGREYAYFNYIDEDSSNMLLAYSYADEEHTFANLVLRYGDLSDEEILMEVSELLATAEQTDLPDTTLEDIAGADTGGISAEVSEYASPVENVALEIGESAVTMAVPENFYIMNFSKEEEDGSYGKSFVSTDGEVDVFLTAMEECYASDVEEWVKNDVFIPDDGANITKSEVQQEQVGEVTVCYQVSSYETTSSYSGKNITTLVLVAVGELPEGGYVEVQAETTGEAGLNFEMVKGFFEKAQ